MTPPPSREYAALLAFVALLSFLLFVITPADMVSKRDLICYWASGQLLDHGADPYDTAAVLAVQRSAGYQPHQALVLRNPPAALPLMIPLGLLGPRAANGLWTFLIVGSIAISIHLIHELNGNPDNRVHLLGYAFAPVLICLIAGQIAAFMLPGVVLFLLLYKRSPFAAGMALSVCAIKPHLLLPFGVVLLFWAVHHKQARILLGLLVGALAASAVPLALRSGIWLDYFRMMRDARLDQEFMPTPSTFFRLFVHPTWPWMQLVPAALACLWAIWYYRRHRDKWQWAGDHGYLLILVSLAVSPRGWVTDEIIALPAILALFYSGCQRVVLACVAVASAVAIGEVFCHVELTSGWYVWTSIVWLGCYLAAARSASDQAVTFGPASDALTPL